MKYILLYLIPIIFFCSCSTRKKDSSSVNDTIIVRDTVTIKMEESERQISTTSSKLDTNILLKYPQIPREVIEYMKERMSDYEVIDTTDYNESWEMAKYYYYELNELPFFSKLDFNGDGLEDYAFLLKKNKDIRLMLLLRTEYFEKYPNEHNFNEIKLYDIGSYYKYDGDDNWGMPYMIVKQKKGALSNLESPEQVNLKYEGLSFIKLGASSAVFFLQNDQISRLYTGT